MITTILTNLNTRCAQLEAGSLTQDEMELLVEDSKELYERLIILRYKIYETNVLGPKKILEPIVSAYVTSDDETAEKRSFDLFEPNEPEELIADQTKIVDVVEEPSVLSEANLFDEVTEVPMDELEAVNDESEDEIALETSAEVLVANEDSQGDTIEIEHDSKEKAVIHEEEIEEEAMDTMLDSESDKIDLGVEPDDNSASDTINGAWILQIEQTIRADRSVFPIETLIGSFSLNEKLQFINELFDGSSDAFSSASKKLDSCANMLEAHKYLTAYSSENSWDLDSEIVEDFIFKICRRYAHSSS